MLNLYLFFLNRLFEQQTSLSIISIIVCFHISKCSRQAVVHHQNYLKECYWVLVVAVVLLLQINGLTFWWTMKRYRYFLEMSNATGDCSHVMDFNNSLSSRNTSDILTDILFSATFTSNWRIHNNTLKWLMFKDKVHLLLYYVIFIRRVRQHTFPTSTL